MNKNGMTRRDFIKWGAAAGGLVVGGPKWVSTALANRHPHPRPTSIKYLDRNMYRKDTDVLAHFGPGEQRGGKMQMMAIGERRFLFQSGDVVEVTDPLKPKMFNKGGFVGSQLQLAYNRKLGKRDDDS
jgi:TAT (twin-arginine translocation) pathway signal sequence